MNPETSLRLFQYDQKLTAVTAHEPSLTLVENGDRLGLLLAANAQAGSSSSRLILDKVTYLRGAGSWTYREIPTVLVHYSDGLWRAEEAAHAIIPLPSRRPYQVVFISQEDYACLLNYLAQKKPGPIFQFARRFFPAMPEIADPGEVLVQEGQTSNLTGTDLQRRAALLQEFKDEREEVMKHKWIESQKAGYDIGFERALADWVAKHRQKWRKGRRKPPPPPEEGNQRK